MWGHIAGPWVLFSWFGGPHRQAWRQKFLAEVVFLSSCWFQGNPRKTSGGVGEWGRGTRRRRKPVKGELPNELMSEGTWGSACWEGNPRGSMEAA